MNSNNSKARDVQNANANLVKNAIDGRSNGEGPTGHFSGIAKVDIIPFESNVLTLGNVNLQFSQIFTRELLIDGASIKIIDGVVDLPFGTTIGGVNTGTIVIQNALPTVLQLPTTSSVGD